MRFKEGDKVQFIENNELIIGTIKRVNNDVGWVDLKVSDLSWFFRKLEDVVKVKEPELIAVPRFAADWIKHCKQREYDLACLLEYGNAGIPDEMYEWLISSADNQELLARAWLDGYEVEQEPLYYIKVIDSDFGYINLNLQTGGYTTSTNGESGGFKTKFTEQEIKELDERYWQFKVPVEEVEETE
ncbi:DUF1642 domain-containing protein [Listeria monocytogenes]|uniref:DUF1642 domain-containing protein n=1 Tax=Listeria monocytogenes TaxID=1639 RepID=UPI001828CEF2|nr:DUF1642 domain-containing protein [Listeria monocytogenes]EAG8279038.1 DUF1642 domain-containing protein [Listeria monocytogenes]MCI2555107.1 DUF1642 domain-containing protein [Listeria monocytogenes]HDT9015590.1 DUF1642 domain-containing protein [Listeria monocytogenes]